MLLRSLISRSFSSLAKKNIRTMVNNWGNQDLLDTLYVLFEIKIRSVKYLWLYRYRRVCIECQSMWSCNQTIGEQFPVKWNSDNVEILLEIRKFSKFHRSFGNIGECPQLSIFSWNLDNKNFCWIFSCWFSARISTKIRSSGCSVVEFPWGIW